MIGAGPSGITAAKNLLQVGIEDFVVYEKSHNVGGNWVYSEEKGHSSVFETTHIISSKPLSQYKDFPMPDSYAEYPSHSELREYFNAYADNFGIRNYIQFNTEVVNAALTDNNTWEIELSDGSTDHFEHLIVCNGHHWDPRMPKYPGEFSGHMIHSHDFKNNRDYKDMRVLVIGGGNSACDIAVETSRVSSKTCISMRRGYYFIPKFLLGKAVDQLNSGVGFIPKIVRNWIFKLLLKLTVGDHTNYGMQKPDHEFLKSHPVVNSELLYFIKHGKIHPKVDIERFDGSKVCFKDGTAEEFDVIIAATGYNITFPFFDKKFIDFSNGDVPLYKRVFHRTHENLFFVGLIQPMGCIWPLSDAHAQLAANKIAGNYSLPTNIEVQVKREVQRIKSQFIDTPRHTVEVDFHDHLAELERELPKNAPKWERVQA